jgi:hypothetical protein
VGSGCIDSVILNLGTRWGWVISFLVPVVYPQGKSPWCPLNRGLAGPQLQGDRFGEDKDLLLLPGIEPRFLCYTARGLITIPSTVSLLILSIYWRLMLKCTLQELLMKCFTRRSFDYVKRIVTLWIRVYNSVLIPSPLWDVTQYRLVVTEVSGQPIASIFKGQAAKVQFFSDCLTLHDETYRLSRNIGKYSA